MGELIELNQGEIKIKFTAPTSGKLTFADMGLKDEDLVLDGGLLRLVFDLEGIGEHNFFKMPTIEVAYAEEVGETHWQCDFNEETILDKMDHHGHSTVILLDRKKIESLEHRHENTLVVHAEFPQGVHLKAADSYVTLFN
ncbi:MAG: hypothetical protein KDC84_12510 [Crocinitomicaceae bacterium]|nr:hypothetical protein [Crocinitomicaceae bacterium]